MAQVYFCLSPPLKLFLLLTLQVHFHLLHSQAEITVIRILKPKGNLLSLPEALLNTSPASLCFMDLKQILQAVIFIFKREDLFTRI